MKETVEEISKWVSFETDIAIELAKHPFLEWRNRKTHRLVKSLFKKGYSLKQTVYFVILNS